MHIRVLLLLSLCLPAGCGGGDKHLPSSNPPEYDPKKVYTTPSSPSVSSSQSVIQPMKPESPPEVMGAPATLAPPVFSGTPAEQLAAARSRLDTLGSYRERRDYTLPNRAVTVVEFSGKLERWVHTNFLEDGGTEVIETIWGGGLAARREFPSAAQWQCYPPIPDSALNPPTIVRDGGTLLVNGKSARRLIEEFVNQMAGSRKTHEVDIDTTTGLPIRLLSTEQGGRH